MDRFKRLWVLVIALTAAGGLAYQFVPTFEPVRMVVFAVLILLLGEVLYRVDKHIAARSK